MAGDAHHDRPDRCVHLFGAGLHWWDDGLHPSAAPNDLHRPGDHRGDHRGDRLGELPTDGRSDDHPGDHHSNAIPNDLHPSAVHDGRHSNATASGLHPNAVHDGSRRHDFHVAHRLDHHAGHHSIRVSLHLARVRHDPSNPDLWIHDQSNCDPPIHDQSNCDPTNPDSRIPIHAKRNLRPSPLDVARHRNDSLPDALLWDATNEDDLQP